MQRRTGKWQTWPPFPHEVICYATSMGKLCGLDLRSNRPAWELTNSAKFGEFCIGVLADQQRG